MSRHKNIVARYGSGAGEFIDIRGDQVNGFIGTITYEHYSIHEGEHYYICGYENEGLNDTIEFIGVTPDTTTWIHFTMRMGCTQQTQFEIYEGASGITGGTSATPLNNNRNSSNTSTVTVTKDPTSITSDGTLIYMSGVDGNRGAASIERTREIILKRNTTYLFRITSLEADNDISYCGEWYEHASLI